VADRGVRGAAELDEEILRALDVARNDASGDVKHISRNASLARWLTELRERRKLGYHPPCPSCRRKDRCVTTNAGQEAESWWCTTYEHEEWPP